MKKRNIVISSVVLAGAIFAGGSLYASEDIAHLKKSDHQKTLHELGIEAKTKDLEKMTTLTDEDGNKWIYNDFVNSGKFEEEMKERYTEDVSGAFIEVQDKIMQKYAKVGDSIPVILLDEELKAGSFSFNRENGEVLIFKLKYNEKNGIWDYEKEE